jgi:hypothetical protein
MTGRHPNATPLESLIEHTAAFSSRDNERYADILSVPFVHLWPDGQVWSCDDGRQISLSAHYKAANLTAENFDHTELDHAVVVLDWPDLKAYHVKFSRYTPRGGNAGQSEAIWVVVRADDGWKVKLRIGAVQTGTSQFARRDG